MSKGSGTTRGDRRRNARRERLREMLPRDGAVIGIDLAEDKQAIARATAGTGAAPSTTRSSPRSPPGMARRRPRSCCAGISKKGVPRSRSQ